MTDYKSILDIKSQLKKLDKAAASKRGKDLISSEDVKSIAALIKTTDKYSNSDWYTLDISEIQTDILILQSGLVQLALKFGDVMSSYDQESAVITSTKSKLRLDAKNIKKQMEDAGEAVKVNLDDYKDLANELTADAAISNEDLRTIGSYLKFIYFAIKDQVQLMEKAVTRFNHRNEIC